MMTKDSAFYAPIPMLDKIKTYNLKDSKDMDNKKRFILQFINYSPRIYSGFDRFNLILAMKLVNKGFIPIFVFTKTMKYVPEIEMDLKEAGAVVELINSNNIRVVKEIFDLFYKYRPVIVHSHFMNHVKILSAFFSFFFGSKFFVSFHSLLSKFNSYEYRKQKGYIKSFFLYLYFRIISCTAKRVFFVSEAIKNQFKDFSKIKKVSKILVLYLGVNVKRRDVDKDSLRKKYALPIDKILIVNVSAIEPIKGIDLLISAVEILKNKFDELPDLLIYHIGGLRSDDKIAIAYRDELKEKVRSLKIEQYFKWLGQRNDILELLSCFDIYVHPSRMEGIPVAIMEAAASSLPIVGSIAGGIPEIVRQGENGFLFISEKTEELAAYIAQLIIDNDMRIEMGEKSFQNVNMNFNIDKQTDRLVQYYLEFT